MQEEHSPYSASGQLPGTPGASFTFNPILHALPTSKCYIERAWTIREGFHWTLPLTHVFFVPENHRGRAIIDACSPNVLADATDGKGNGRCTELHSSCAADVCRESLE